MRRIRHYRDLCSRILQNIVMVNIVIMSLSRIILWFLLCFSQSALPVRVSKMVHTCLTYFSLFVSSMLDVWLSRSTYSSDVFVIALYELIPGNCAVVGGYCWSSGLQSPVLDRLCCNLLYPRSITSVWTADDTTATDGIRAVYRWHYHCSGRPFLSLKS